MRHKFREVWPGLISGVAACEPAIEGQGVGESRFLQNAGILGGWRTPVSKTTFPVPRMAGRFSGHTRSSRTKERRSSAVPGCWPRGLPSRLPDSQPLGSPGRLCRLLATYCPSLLCKGLSPHPTDWPLLGSVVVMASRVKDSSSFPPAQYWETHLWSLCGSANPSHGEGWFFRSGMTTQRRSIQAGFGDKET